MLTASKRWGIVTGFVIVAVAIVAGAFWSRAQRTVDAPVTALTAPVPAGPEVLPRPASGAVQPTPADAKPTAADAALPKPAPNAAAVPRFDVVRVEPTGESVVAGQAAPNASVDLVASGKVVAQAPTDAEGHFVMLPPALKPGDYALSLHQTGADATASDSKQSVAVSVPEKGKGQVVVAVAEPGRASKLLSPPPIAMPGLAVPAKEGPAGAVRGATGTSEAPAPAASGVAATGAGLAVRSVELENGNGFFTSGAAAPGTKLHVYLNNSHLADVMAGADGAWSVKIKKGLTGGHYVVRADAAAGAGVGARVEVPFDVPVAMSDAAGPPSTPAAAGPPPASPAPLASTTPPVAGGVAVPPGTPTAGAPAAGMPTHAVIDEINTAVVRRGDNLWDISRVRLGQGRRYTRIYAANATQIRDPSLIYPGQVFVVPAQND